MAWFRNLTIGIKLLLGFGAMIVLLGVTIVVAYNAITSIRDSQQRLFDKEFIGVVDVVELRAGLNRQRVRMLEILLTNDRGRQESLVQDIQDRDQRIDQTLEELTSVYGSNTKFLLKLEELKTVLPELRQTREENIKLIFAGKVEEAGKTVESIQAERYEKMRGIAIELEQELQGQAGTQIKASNELATQTIRLFAILGGLALLVGSTLAMLFSQLISWLVAEITDTTKRLASGNLTATLVTEQRTDEIGMLRLTFARMTEELRIQISGLAEGANLLGSAVNEIVSSTTQLAARASESAVAVSETTSTVEEVRQTAQVASQKAKQVSDSAQKAAQSSHSGRKSIDDVNSGMERIRQQMDAIAVSMVRLSEQGQAIGQIIASVEDLATQSNLLAVNAAIEAAKAGEHGKGFSVVAQEVKSLAEQSRQATTQVRTILGDIQKATATAVMATEQGSKAVEAGSRQTEVAGEAIQALAGSVTESAQAATQIAASSQQQLVGIDQVAGAMEDIRQASAQNVASAQQLEAAARNLNELGQRLRHMVERYKV